MKARPRRGWRRWLRIARWIAYAVILGGSVSLRLFVLQPGCVISSSMAPTLHKGDFVFVNRRAYLHRLPQPGEIVAFYSRDRTQTWMKRVVAGPGDRVELRSHVLYRNGTPVREPYIRILPDAAPDPTWRNLSEGGDEAMRPQDVGPNHRFEPVPPGHVIVLGDNRNYSDDSRRWGPLRRDYLIGRAFVVVWPLRHARLLR